MKYVVNLLDRENHRSAEHFRRLPSSVTTTATIYKSRSKLTSESLMISPLVRQSFLLSSNTVFMFSIHTASTGPSNRYHFLSLVVLELPTRIIDDKIPSVLKAQQETIHEICDTLHDRILCTEGTINKNLNRKGPTSSPCYSRYWLL